MYSIISVLTEPTVDFQLDQLHGQDRLRRGLSVCDRDGPAGPATRRHRAGNADTALQQGSCAF